MKVRYELRQRGRGLRKCRVCGGSRAVIRSYRLYICRRCFREAAKNLGFEKLS
ncbi:MAG: 30S ribosomal protein S14 [Candidatus Micrarchaeota archaeon]|nr:30S ribosomal protein S14 [Candidatus Micrarchaeota archaeon]MDE1864566.1 30S ribosomal protein S14 [Candidatus Micrarchaeota archaeon]